MEKHKQVLNCMVLDDDPEAVATLVNYIGLALRMRVCFAGTDPHAALRKIGRLRPDILFIDMEMEKMSGLDFLAQIKEYIGTQRRDVAPLQVIVCSAYRDYGVDCIAYQVCDYLVKPFGFPRFIESVDKAKRKILLLPSIATLKGGYELFLVKIKKSVIKKAVYFDDIIYVEASGNDSLLWLDEDTSLEVKIQVREIELLLPPEIFVKVHRSFIISLDYVEEVGRDAVKMHHLKRPIPIGDRKLYPDFVNWEMDNSI